MQNRSRHRWLDIQIILASLAVTFTLGLWNVFAKGSRPVVSPAAPPTPDPASTFTFTPSPTATPTADPSAPLQLPKVHLLLGGKMPVAPVVMAASPADSSPANTSKTRSNAQKAGGGNPVPAPPPVTNTGSSKP